MDLNAEISSRLAAFEAAKEALIETVALIQATCAHQVVTCLPREDGRYVRSNARRICLHCRYEEEGSSQSGVTYWGRCDYQPTQLDKAKYVLTSASTEAFCALRLPVRVPPTHPNAIESDKVAPAQREAQRVQTA